VKATETTERTSSAPDTIVETERLIGATLIVGIAAAIVAFTVLSWLTREMLAGETAWFDELVRSAVNEAASARLTGVMRFASEFGGPSRLMIVGGAVLVVFLAKRWYRGAVLLAVAFLGAWLLDLLLKHSFERARPVPFFDQPLPSSYSFPSGHALFAFVFFGSFAALLMQRVRGVGWRMVILAAATSLVGLIGLSRIYLGVHYPSDVVAGYLVALVWIVVVAVGDRLASQGVFTPKRRRG
jgi:membrane-associated phospholipid phosphatase